MNYLLFYYFLSILKIVYCYEIKRLEPFIDFIHNQSQDFIKTLEGKLTYISNNINKLGKKEYFEYGIREGTIEDNDVIYYQIWYLYNCNIKDINCINVKDLKNANEIILKDYCKNNKCYSFGNYSSGALYIEYSINNWPVGLQW